MSDSLVAFWQKIEPRLRIIVFVVFIALFLIVLYLKNSESAEIAPVDTQPTSDASAAKDDQRVAAAEQSLKEDLAAKKPTPIRETPFAALIANSMFDVKAIRDAVLQEHDANAKYQQALDLFNQKKYRESMDMVKQCLAIRANHLRAKELQNELDAIFKQVGPRAARAKPE